LDTGPVSDDRNLPGILSFWSNSCSNPYPENLPGWHLHILPGQHRLPVQSPFFPSFSFGADTNLAKPEKKLYPRNYRPTRTLRLQSHHKMNWVTASLSRPFYIDFVIATSPFPSWEVDQFLLPPSQPHFDIWQPADAVGYPANYSGYLENTVYTCCALVKRVQA
jgi:hypothetical protein